MDGENQSSQQPFRRQCNRHFGGIGSRCARAREWTQKKISAGMHLSGTFPLQQLFYDCDFPDSIQLPAMVLATGDRYCTFCRPYLVYHALWLETMAEKISGGRNLLSRFLAGQLAGSGLASDPRHFRLH